MKLYGKKFLKKYIDKMQDAHVETRDGILWDILSDQRLCRVKIQGSNTLVVANYPENWERIPLWLKKGNAVRIVHTQGLGGRIEVVGHGQMVPTPLPGSTTLPPPEIPVDAIISGCRVTACATPRMAVLVNIGVLRFGGVEHTLTPIAMLNGANFQIGDGGAMSIISGAVGIAAAPGSPNYRYDLISIGEDLVIDYTAGTPDFIPERPELALDHLALDYILIANGVTTVLKSDIIGSAEFEPPRVRYIWMDPEAPELAWGELSLNFDVIALDQHRLPIGGTGSGWHMEVEMIMGNGMLSQGIRESETYIDGYSGSNAFVTFGYTRNGTIDDKSVMLNLSFIDALGYSHRTVMTIILLDEFGDPMW